MKIHHNHHQLRIIALCMGLIFGIITVAACSASSTTHTSLATKAECGVQYHHWYKNGGKGIVVSIESQAGPISQALQAHNTAELKTVTSKLQADTNQLANHMPPNCIPGVDHDVTVMLAFLNKAALRGQQNKLPQAQAALKNAGQAADQLGKDVSAYVR